MTALKLMVNKWLRCIKRVNMFDLKKYERKITPPFIIDADFESILVPEDNRKQNLDEAYTNKYWKYVACCYDFKLVCVDEKLSKVSEYFL